MRSENQIRKPFTEGSVKVKLNCAINAHELIFEDRRPEKSWNKPNVLLFLYNTKLTI